jgi:predicted metal-binding membrane protein
LPAVRSQLKFESLLSRPNRLIVAALALLTALAWLQVARSGPAAGVSWQRVQLLCSLLQPGLHAWGPRDLGIAFLMWMLMAVAMMLPTAVPAILAFADIARAGHQGARAAATIGAFLLGYLWAWGGFGALATATQWGLETATLRVAAFNGGRPLLGGALLIGAGLYQFSALKDLCLTQCRSPMAFFLAHWRAGIRGASYLGLRHGLHCVGCCWALMALMLLAGTMNLAWVAGLTALMLAEKLAPAGRVIGRGVGMALIFWGGALIGSSLFEGVLS